MRAIGQLDNPHLVEAHDAGELHREASLLVEVL
jgi:hypothetical protein